MAKAVGEAAVAKLAEAGAKSADYKAGYAKIAGEQFLAAHSNNEDEAFINGFFESLLAGKSVEEIETMKTPTQDSAAGRNIEYLADGSVRLAFADGSSVVASKYGQTFFDIAGYPARGLTPPQMQFLAGDNADQLTSLMVDAGDGRLARRATTEAW